MTSTIIYQRTYYGDINGQPLDSGKVYVGVANQDPEQYPVACFWDEALTVPALQPLTVTSGYITNNGIRAAVYTATSTYSVLVKNRAGIQVDYAPSIRDADYAAALLASTGLSLIGTPEGTLESLLYDNTALPLARGRKKFARRWSDALAMAEDLTNMRGFAAYAGTTGGTGYPAYRVYDSGDNIKTPGTLRWALDQISTAGGGHAIIETRGKMTIRLKSSLIIPPNCTISAPGRNCRIVARNDTFMLLGYSENWILRWLNVSRLPSLTDIDSEIYISDVSTGLTGFDVPFSFATNDELRVYKIDGTTAATTLLEETTDYTLTGAGQDAGGRATLLVATANEKVKLQGQVYSKDGLSIDPTRANRFWIDECTFCEHSDGNIDIASSGLETGLVATAIQARRRYKITTVGTTDWNAAAGTSAVTYHVGDVITTVVAGTDTAGGTLAGTGVVRTADFYGTLTRTLDRNSDHTHAFGSSATGKTPAPAWAPTALDEAPCGWITLDNCVYEGCGQRKPRVSGLMFVDAINTVDGISAYRRDDGTSGSEYGAYSNTGGKLLMRGCNWYKYGPAVAGISATICQLTAWDDVANLGPGALKVVGCTADDGMTVQEGNTSYIDAISLPYTITPDTVPVDLEERKAWRRAQLEAAGAEISPLSEMNYQYVSKADAEADPDWYADGYHVIDVGTGYRVAVRDDIEAQSDVSETDLTATSLTIQRGQTLTIADGETSISLLGDMYFILDATGTAPYTLANIYGGQDGDVIGMRLASSARPITLITGGNIGLPSARAMRDTGSLVFLRYDGSTWAAIGGSGNEGTYTPTLTGVANVASSSVTAAWYTSPIGSAYVRVNYNITVTPTAGASTITTLGMSLPIASALASASDANGTGNGANGTTTFPVFVAGDAANDRASLQFVSPGTVAYTLRGTFDYKVM